MHRQGNRINTYTITVILMNIIKLNKWFSQNYTSWTSSLSMQSEKIVATGSNQANAELIVFVSHES